MTFCVQSFTMAPRHSLFYAWVDFTALLPEDVQILNFIENADTETNTDTDSDIHISDISDIDSENESDDTRITVIFLTANVRVLHNIAANT